MTIENFHDVIVTLTTGQTIPAVEFHGHYFSGLSEITSKVIQSSSIPNPKGEYNGH